MISALLGSIYTMKTSKSGPLSTKRLLLNVHRYIRPFPTAQWGMMGKWKVPLISRHKAIPAGRVGKHQPRRQLMPDKKALALVRRNQQWASSPHKDFSSGYENQIFKYFLLRAESRVGQRQFTSGLPLSPSLSILP